MKKVSVVIPTYNRKEFLEDAVESVKKQTYDNIEVIIVDGGSEDGTKEFLESIQDKETKVFIRKRPKGQANARNKGIEESDGEYILFLDDDDTLKPETVEKMVRTVQGLDQRCVGIYTGEEQFGQITKIKSINSGRCDKVTELSFGTSCTLFKSKLFNEIEGFKEDLKASEDLEFIIRVFSKGYCLYGIDEPLYRRRIHEGQLTKDYMDVIEANYRILGLHEKNLSFEAVLERYEKISRLYLKLGMEEEFSKSLKNYIDFLEAHRNRLDPFEIFKRYEQATRLSIKTGNNAEALNTLEHCEKLAESDEKSYSIENRYYFYRKTSILHRKLGKFENSGKWLEKTLKLLKDHEKSFDKIYLHYRRLGLKFVEIDDFGSARFCFKASIKRNNFDRFSYYFYFWSLFGKQGYETGRKIEDLLKNLGLLQKKSGK